MSRSPSNTFREAVFSQQTTEAFIVLLTIDHDDLSTSIRVCLNSTDIVSNGLTYQGYYFDISLPDDSDENISSGKITIDNVSGQIIDGIRLLDTPPNVQIDVVLASDPDTLEATFPDFQLTDVTYDALTIQGNLSIQNFMNEPYPGGIMGPNNFRGLF